MKVDLISFVLAAFSFFGCRFDAAQHTARVENRIEQYNLTPVRPGIFRRETYRSADTLNARCLTRSMTQSHVLVTSEYYLITSHATDYFHALKGMQIWNFCEGAPLALTVIDPTGDWQEVVLDNNRFQFVIPSGWWHIAEVTTPGYSLVSITTVPGFEKEDLLHPPSRMYTPIQPHTQSEAYTNWMAED